MKRANDLFDQISAWDNLLAAVHQASRGKRHRCDTQAFCLHLSDNLRRIQEELTTDSFRFGRFHQFVIHDPRRRIITAPCFEERVVHHAIINVCEPVFERFLINDSFACRRGLGRLAALERAQTFSRRHTHYVKMDIKKFFDNVDHATLLELLHRRYKDSRLLNLLAEIVHCYEVDPGKGLPIGSLTSQHLANFYLGWFDRFVKEQLRIAGYVRYMDDCLIWGKSRASVRSAYFAAQRFLCDGLQFNTKPPIIGSVKRGIGFLGCRVFPNYLVLDRRSRRRFKAKLGELSQEYRNGKVSEIDCQQRATAMIAFARAGGTRSWRFRNRAVSSFAVDG